MERYSISEVWNNDPDDEAMVRTMLELLLIAEGEGWLDELLGSLVSSSGPTSPPAANEAA